DAAEPVAVELVDLESHRLATAPPRFLLALVELGDQPVLQLVVRKAEVAEQQQAKHVERGVRGIAGNLEQLLLVHSSRPFDAGFLAPDASPALPPALPPGLASVLALTFFS